MSELTLLILRIGFLILLWLFIFSIVYALRSDLFGAPVRKLPAESLPGGTPAPASPPVVAAAPVVTPPVHVNSGNSPASGSGPAKLLVITSGSAAGTSLPLDEDVITIGRSSDSSLVIVDEYTSTYHARLNRNGDQWMLTDLDSTNGTKLTGSRVRGTVLVPPGAPITIGTTTFELRR